MFSKTFFLPFYYIFIYFSSEFYFFVIFGGGKPFFEDIYYSFFFKIQNEKIRKQPPITNFFVKKETNKQSILTKNVF